LFWLFVAGAGFMAGWQIASQFIQGPEWVGIVVGIFFAIVAAFLAVFLKTVAIGVAGFLMGGVVLTGLAGLFGIDQGLVYWALFVVGGIGGVILIGMFFDLALIWLSSLAGAMLIIRAFPLEGISRILVLVAVLFLGVIFQSSQRKNEKE
jgi:hypothetical protein